MLPIVNRSAGLARRLALALVVASAAGAAGWLGWNALWRSEVAFLPRQSPAQWIVYPSAPEGTLHPRLELSTEFKRSFVLERAPARAELRVAGFHRYELLINGAAPGSPARQAHTWKQPDSYEAAGQLRAGENRIAVTVFNTNGPPAMWLCLEAPGLELRSDERWEASYAGATWRTARLASQPGVVAPGNAVYGGEQPWASWQARWRLLILFTALSAAGYWALRWWSLRSEAAGEKRGWRLEMAPVAVLAGAWAVLFANNLGVLPNLVGYDVTGHLPYIRYIQELHSLPLASDGWEMFQPPLYYVVGAALLETLSCSVADDAGIMALRVLGLAIGVAHFVLVWASLRLLFPGERSKPRWGLVLAACLPPLLYLSQYVSNEGLAAALVSASVYLTLRILQARGGSWKLNAGLSLCLGAALLTKSTALLALPVILGALVFKEVQSLKSKVQSRGTTDGRQESEAGEYGLWGWTGRMGVVLAVCALVCGWHYARVWAHYGNPLIGVWDPRTGFAWWEDEGYRTGAFYLRFGAALVHPWFSALQSFGDGIYSTLWGDGLVGGAADISWRPPWNYELMCLGYWLALVPAAGVITGAILALVKFLRRPSADWFLVTGLGFVIALAVVHMSMAVPYYCMVKAFYGLAALVPLCAFGAAGLETLCRWSGKLRPVICILFGVWALNAYTSFWIPRSSVAALLVRARSLVNEGRALEARELLKAQVQATPHSAETRCLLAWVLAMTGNVDEGVRQAEIVAGEWPNDASGHLALGSALAQQRRVAEAVAHARRALELEPGRGFNYQQLASLLVRQGQNEEAIRVARDGLGFASHNSELRFTLGAALVSRGETVEGIAQLQLASALNPNWCNPHVLLGATLAKQGRLDEAANHWQEALRLEPGNAEAHCQLAIILGAQRQVTEAIAHYTEALRLEPDLSEALNNLAWIRAAHPQAEFRDGPEAVRLAERACRVTGNKESMLVGTLAAAYAEAGRFEEAMAAAGQARALALAGGQKDLAEKNEKLLELFRARHPYREPVQP